MNDIFVLINRLGCWFRLRHNWVVVIIDRGYIKNRGKMCLDCHKVEMMYD